MQKSIGFKIKGMQRDLSVSAFNPEYSYENKNIRIMSTDDNTLFSIVNEKGNKSIDIEGIDYIKGTPIGQATIDDNLILFTKGDNIEFNIGDISSEDKEVNDITVQDFDLDFDLGSEDSIYKLNFNKDKLNGKVLFKGNLNFKIENPIEAISVFENNNVKKVYWVDGINNLRFINIEAKDSETEKWDSNSFNISQNLKLNEVISITKNNDSIGEFHSGTIQYAFSYYNKYGIETNIFYVSDLYYLSYNDRGGSPEDKISCSFSLHLKNLDDRFQFIRVYSIFRSSINSTPEVKVIRDVEVSNDVVIVDNGTIGYSIDPTELLYIGGENIIPGTMCHKDNTLFLGDIKLNDYVLTEEDIDTIKSNCNISFEYKELDYTVNSEYYLYNNQLNNSSSRIKGFKGGEIYRVAIQLQFKDGKYSQPIYIQDIQNTLYPKVKDGKIYIPNLVCTLTNINIGNAVKYRLLMAVPQSTDKSIICQGILSPTLYNINDRINNAPYSISSWFMRYNSVYDTNDSLEWKHNYPLPDNSKRNAELQNTVNPSLPYIENRKEEVTTYKVYFYYYSVIGTLNHGYVFYIKENEEEIFFKDCLTYEAAKEEALIYVDENKIPSESTWFNSTSEKPYEIDLSSDVPNISITDKFVSDEANNFYVDQSILTLHSPDITEDTSFDGSNLKLRIVGIVELTSNMSDFSITTSTPLKDEFSIGEIEYDNDKPNLSTNPYGLINAPLWNDTAKTDGSYKTLFAVYPWHRSGSLNDSSKKDGTTSSMLKRKVISNLRYSYSTKYFANKWEAYIKDSLTNTGITQVNLFSSNELSNIRIPKPENSNLSDLNYYGNLDKLLPAISTKNPSGYPIQHTGKIYGSVYNSVNSSYIQVEGVYGTDPISIKYKSTPHLVFSLNYTKHGIQNILPALNSKLSFISYDKENSLKGYLPWDTGYLGDISTIKYWTVSVSEKPQNPEVGDLWYAEDYGAIQEYVGDNNWVTKDYPYNSRFIYESKYYILVKSDEEFKPYKLIEFKGVVNQDILDESTIYPYLYIAELYRDIDKNTIYGGTSQKALEDNQWIPISENITIGDKILYTEGDTYFQRWDCLKTYSYTEEDYNSIVDITSFMCESRINLDGRYDKNRGQKNNLSMSPTNFNLFNTSYNQPNNFFNYRILDTKYNLSEFPNSIIWSKEKSLAEDIDTWANIKMSSIIDLDGDKGRCRAIRRLNNELIAFQDKGISNILFNSRTQISSSEGVPIEIANSGKVDGKRYITDRIGCTNKWSICETQNGIYFIDDITKGIFLFNGKLDNLSDKLGFHSWINSRSTSINIWNPKDFNGFVTYYDKVNGDVFFISKNECLAFSEPLGQFTSFYSYENTPYFSNIGDKGLFINTEYNKSIYKVWLHNEGDYNMYFGKYNPFYVNIIANPNSTKDKVFNTLEFRADSWKDTTLLNTTFDTLDTWNEYQHGTTTLTSIMGKPSNLKRKFRIWRANIPRDNSNKLDRMRNTWLYIKLSMNKDNTNKTILHDMVVNYFEF